MDENVVGTPGTGQFEMVPSDVIRSSQSFAGAAEQMPGTLTDALNAALAMLTANPGFAASQALRAACQIDLVNAVGDVRAETDDGSRLLRTMAEKTRQADEDGRDIIRTRLDSALPEVP